MQLTYLRRLQGMTQAQFADFCNVSRTSIARYEAGASISRNSAIKIATACGITIDELLGVNLMAQPDKSDAVASFRISPEETKLLINYRNLNNRGKRRANETMRELALIYTRKKKSPDNHGCTGIV